MKNFLARTAEYISRNLQKNLQDTLVLVPNKRTGVFLEKQLMQEVSQPFILPKIQTIEEFMEEHSSFVLVEPLELNLMVYSIFQRHLPIYESFDQFYHWGEMLLRDFNDIDKNLVNAADLFQLMEDEKEIERQFQYLSEEQIEVIQKFWSSFSPPDYTGNQKDFVDTWRVLKNIYADFNEQLTATGKAYSGKMFRDVSNRITSHSLELSYSNILFVGFHILSRSEEKIFRFFDKNKKGKFFWDVDYYYLDREYSRIKNHEAGTFLRNYIKEFTNSIEISHFEKDPPQLHFMACPKSVGQAMAVKQIINDKHIGYNEKTAVILPDESMLLPALQSLSSSDEPMNITLGYSLQNGALTGMIDNWLEVFKFRSGGKFYYKPVIRLINHAYVKTLYPKETDDLQLYIQNNNLIYIFPDDLVNHPFLQQFLNVDHTSSTDIIKAVRKVTESIYYHYFDLESKTGPQIFETEVLFHSLIAFNKLNELLDETGVTIQPETLKKLLFKYIGSVSVNFSGEPVVGLQVMGLLESRNLDFENVFILSSNEGILPASISGGSYIPYSLRAGFGLPTYTNNDSMFAYYIYRLLHQSKNVYFMYNNVATGNTRAEPSRYIVQLKLESGLPYQESQQKIEFLTPKVEPIVIKKTQEVLNKMLHTYSGEEGRILSPSALNVYLDCSLKFYLRYIAHIKEPDELTDEIDAATFGNLLHNAMQNVYVMFYEKYGKNIIEEKDILSLKELAGAAIKAAMKTEFTSPLKPREVELTGDYYIIYHILEQYVLNIIRMDELMVPKNLPINEEDKFFDITITSNDKPLTLRLGGRLDRIDVEGDKIKVIDYKTGKTDNKTIFNGVDQLFDRKDEKRKDYIFQIFLYTWLLQEFEYKDKTVVPQLLFIRDTYQDDFKADIFLKTGKQMIPVNSIIPFKEEFREGLQTLLKELFDKEIPFNQTDNIKKCQYCAYVDICTRRE